MSIQNDVDFYQNNFNSIIGGKLDKFYFASATLMLGFGNMIQIDLFDGRKRVVSRYSIHIQCRWEIYDNDELVLSYEDAVYREYKELTLFADSLYFDRFRDIFVEDVKVCGNFSLEIFLSENKKILIFTTPDDKEENWRFIDMKKDIHIVFPKYLMTEKSMG